MAADEVTARRRFRQRLDAIGEQYPTLKTPEAQERLTRELARQASEGGAMAEDIKRGRPRGKMAETIELKTVSFKLTPALLARVQKYAKEHRLTFSELVREGLEVRLEQEDPLDYRYRVQTDSVSLSSGNTGNTDSEAMERIEGMLQAMQTVITQQGEQIQALVQALERQTAPASNGASDTATTMPATDVALSYQEAQHTQLATLTDEPRPESTIPATVPAYNTSKHHVGKLCPRGHDHENTGHSLRNTDNQCLRCNAERKAAKDAKKRQAKAATK